MFLTSILLRRFEVANVGMRSTVPIGILMEALYRPCSIVHTLVNERIVGP